MKCIPMKIVKLAHPNGIEATTGLAQLISLLAVHANQNRLIGIPKQPISAGYNLYSGATRPSVPAAWEARTCGWYKMTSHTTTVARARTQPTPIPRKTRPFCSVLKEYTLLKTYGKAAKKANRTEKLKAVYMDKKATIGSVTSMWSGRVRVMVSKNLIFSNAGGPGGIGIERRLARRRRIVFL